MNQKLPFNVPDCVALHLAPNFVIPLLDAKDEKDERINILKKKLLPIFSENEIKVVNLKDKKKDKLFFYHDDFYGLPILFESPRLNWFSVTEEKEAA